VHLDILQIVQDVLECYNIVGEDYEDEDLRNLKILETEGECAVEGLELESVEYANPLKIIKVNIGTKENPKFKNIGYDWNKEIVEKIVDLLHEY
jgi:hypothetical protein